MPKVSIVLPCYNEEAELAFALKEIENQTFKDTELLIVDDGSTDGTRGIAANYCTYHPNARLIPIKHSGLTHVRNVGIQQSSGEIIFFAESDCAYEPDYIEKAVQALLINSEANCVCLTGAPLVARHTLAVRCIEIENILQHKLLAQGKLKPYYAWVFRRGPLLAIGGFDERLFQGEDKDIFKRFMAAGNKVTWVPGIHWRHKRDQTTAQLTKKFFQRARSRVRYITKHRLWFDLAKKLLPLWTCVFGVLLLLTPVKIVGASLILIILAVFLIRSIRVGMIVWNTIQKRRYLLWYPVYVILRNFASGLGYTYGLISPYRYVDNSSNEERQNMIVGLGTT